MARFQTRLAELLGPPSRHTVINWSKLERATGVSGKTLKTWYEAAPGSKKYLHRIDGEVLGELMNYFNVSMDELVVTVVSDPRLARSTV